MRILSLVACIVASAAVVRADSEVAKAGKALATAMSMKLPNLSSLDSELFTAEAVSSVQSVSAQKTVTIQVPQCFGRTGGKSRGGYSINTIYAPLLAEFDTDKCMLNGLLGLLPPPEEQGPSAFTDMVVGPIAWANFMMNTFGTPSCNGVPTEVCTFENTKGMCVLGKDFMCTESAYSIFFFPLVPKYTCPGSIADSILSCWKQSAMTGSCDGSCAPVPEATLTGLLSGIGILAPFENDPAISCFPALDAAALTQVTDGFTSFIVANLKKIKKLGKKSPLPWNYPAEFTSLFSTDDQENGQCDGSTAAQVMFFDLVSLQKGDTSFLGMKANECDDSPIKRPFTAKRCKKIGSHYSINPNTVNEMIPPIPFDTTASSPGKK